MSVPASCAGTAVAPRPASAAPSSRCQEERKRNVAGKERQHVAADPSLANQPDHPGQCEQHVRQGLCSVSASDPTTPDQNSVDGRRA